MATRTFDGIDDQVVISTGGVRIGGEITVAAIVRRILTDSTGSWSYVLNTRSGSDGWAFGIKGDTNKLMVDVDGVGGLQAATLTLSTTEGYCLIACTKATGSQYRFHKYNYATNTWSHEDQGGSTTNPSAATSGTHTLGGSSPWWWNGSLFIVGEWNAAMSDTEVERLAYDRIAWMTEAPAGLWQLDQAATTMKVRDMSGLGANESSLVGTAVSTDGVPVFSYGGSILVSGRSPAISQTFALPWEVVGAAASSALGSILSTQSVARVYEGSAAPTANDDVGDGYAPGDVWVYGNQAWWCVSAAAAAAVWKKVTA